MWRRESLVVDYGGIDMGSKGERRRQLLVQSALGHFSRDGYDGATTKATAKNIHTFIQDNIEYREDPPGVQDIKSPAKLYASGFGDCKSFSLFAGSVLQNLGISYYYRFVGFAGDDEVTHVYVVVQDGPQEYIIDAVPPIAFNEETPHAFATDLKAPPHIGACPQPAPQPAAALTYPTQSTAPLLVLGALALLLAGCAGQLQRPVNAQGDTGHGQGAQQLQGGHPALALQQLAQAGHQQRGRAGTLALAGGDGNGEQPSDFLEHLLPGPAVEQLLTKAAVLQQGGLQQPDQVTTALGLEQVEPNP